MKQFNRKRWLYVMAALLPIMGMATQNRSAQSMTTNEANDSLNEPGIYGYVGGGNFGKKMGLYKVFEDGGNEFMWSEALQDKSFTMLNGWIRDNALCGFAQFGVGSMVFGYAYEELDLLTGEEKSAPYLIELNDSYLPYYQIVTYNPNNDKLYGYGFVESYGDKSVFKSSPASQPANVSVVNEDIAPEEVCLALCYNDDKNVMAGINLNHEFVYVGEDGSQTVIMDLGIPDLQNVVSALVWSPADGYYIFNAIISGKVSELYAINPEEESVTLLSPVSDGLTYMFMVATGHGSPEAAPEVPEIISLDFGKGETDGSVIVRMPKINCGGETLGTAELVYTVWLDGEVYSEGNANAGENVEVQFNNISQGEHVFRVTASVDSLISPKATVRAYIGYDIPEAPTNVLLSLNNLSWDAVTSGVHGGYVDLDNMEYEVYLNDEWIETTSDTYVEISLPEGELTAYSCRVYALCNGKESASGESNAIVYGSPLSLPVNIDPTQEQADLTTVLDANSDDSTWHPRNYKGGVVFSYYNDEINSGDDWLFLPGIEFNDPDAYYSISVETCCNSLMSSGEYYEVWLTSTPDLTGEKICVLNKTQASVNGFEEKYIGFTIPNPGVWHVAFRAVSNPAQQYLNIRNIQIDNTGATIEGPLAVTDVAFVDKSNDSSYLSEISFKLPEARINGEIISADTEVRAAVTGVSQVLVKGKPGSEQIALVEVGEGFSKVEIQTFIDDDLAGAKCYTQVYAGPDAPGYISDLKATVADDNMSADLSWKAPETGRNGGSVNSEEISYRVILYNGKIWTYPAPEITETTYTYSVTEDDTKLRNYILSVASINDKGMTDEDQPITIVQLGMPYSLPMIEDFPEGEASITPFEGITIGDYSGTYWAFGIPSEINEKYAFDNRAVMIGGADKENAKGLLMLPKFSSEDIDKPIELTMVVWTGDNAADIKVMGIAAGDSDAIEVGSVEKGTGWKEIKFVLPLEMSGKSWVSLWIETEFDSPDDYVMLAEYAVTVSPVTGVNESVNNFYSVYGGKGFLRVKGTEGADIVITTLDGKLYDRSVMTAESYVVSAPSGLYFVSVDGRVSKVMVK